jgi:hypothetical protein
LFIIFVDSLRHERLELLRGVVRRGVLLLVRQLLVLDVVLRVRPLLTKANGGEASRRDVNVRTAGRVTRPSWLVDPDDLLDPGHRGVDGAI